ncbi:ATP-binding protein [Micromonospora sp. CPCC 206060]|uniref:ATP-binding protein n=1 Tax=Micromonospora sp. CPCC 206060 TaxID=3122406 RepID=UPI002FF161AA
MPTDVRCLVTNDGSRALVRATGTLDPAGARSLRDMLLARRADHPGPLVVEVSGLRATGPDSRAVFADVRTAAAEWPVAELLLCAENGMAARDWTGHGVAVSRTPAEALAGTVPVTPLDVPLEPAVGAAKQARELVTDACLRWGVPELAGPGCIAVTEMVNNVVTHAHTPMTLRLAVRDGALRLAVRDWSAERPAYAGLVSPTATGGRGLLLIDAVARRWGDTPVSDGKVVWAVLHPEDAAEY